MEVFYSPEERTKMIQSIGHEIYHMFKNQTSVDDTQELEDWCTNYLGEVAISAKEDAVNDDDIINQLRRYSLEDLHIPSEVTCKKIIGPFFNYDRRDKKFVDASYRKQLWYLWVEKCPDIEVILNF